VDRLSVQSVTWLLYFLVLGVLAFKAWRYRRRWLVLVPVAIDVVLTLLFYWQVFTVHGALGVTNYSDWSAGLRFLTGLTFLYYALYLPLGLGGKFA
jgi:hypothetical protein